MTFAPEGGYGDIQGQSVFTHGLQVGMEGSNARDLRMATTQLTTTGAEQPEPSSERRIQQRSVCGSAGPCDGIYQHVCHAPAGGHCSLHTRLNDGSLFFVVGVAPANEFRAYQQIFNRSVQSLALNGR